MLAQLSNVSLSFPDKKVLEKVSLTIYPGDRLALVGANGAGKTSIFRMIAGRLEPDAGTVSWAGGIRIGHLEQGSAGPEDEAGLTCMEEAAEGARADKPCEADTVRVEFAPSRGRGQLRAEGLTVGYSSGRPLGMRISFDLSAGDRLAVLGPNGCGKTALLRTVMGRSHQSAARCARLRRRGSGTLIRTIASRPRRPRRPGSSPERGATRHSPGPSWDGCASGGRP